MSNAHNLVVYLGSGKAGSSFRKKITYEARRRGYVKKNGKVALAPFIKDCLEKEINIVEIPTEESKEDQDAELSRTMDRKR